VISREYKKQHTLNINYENTLTKIRPMTFNEQLKPLSSHKKEKLFLFIEIFKLKLKAPSK